ncbi:MAG: Stk1 family PASTA domain-containing Ser/Thr kinase [Ruminococcaceae bacterium]|nr:Stk1 family PASTA domain-containing Ser/Thr kinase [Oscillospiraceae bacterium]
MDMDMDKYIGRVLDDRYEILEKIGTGGMAVVYKARCRRLNRLVAIKILRAEFIQDEEFRSRFHAESRAVAMLSHPNIVSVYDVSTTNEADYIVMELIDGITLKQYMEKKGTVNWKETLHFAIQIAKALEHAHSRGIIHRDIKPHNVMVLKNGSVKVTDFGIARVMNESNTLTKEALGSVHYLSPEQAKGGRVDIRSDIYSLGVVMYEMATGRPPYDGETPVAVAIQHINGKATLPSAINPHIPGGLEQIIVRCMSQQPADRFPSASALLTDLDEFRKNPTILFDYNNPDKDIDDATRLQPPPRKPEDKLPPVKPARERTGSNGGRSGSSKRSSSGRKPARRREVIVEEKEERSKAATIAILVCAAVALIAVVFLGVALANSNSAEGIITAPSLVGKIYDASQNYGDVTLEVKYEHSDTYPAGTIMDQSPRANQRMNRGDTVRILVSWGPKPVEVKMPNMIGADQDWAERYLKDLDLNLHVIPRKEYNSTVTAGCVIRTNPVEGTVLLKGQTVDIWISAGSQVAMADLPKVSGYTQMVATNMLNKAGFFNVEIEEVESEHPKGTVLEQRPEGGYKMDVTTTIQLKVSKGPAEDPVDPPVVLPDYTLMQQIPLALPMPATEDCVLTIWVGDKLVAERQIYAGTIMVDVKLWGEGLMTYTAKLSDTAGTTWDFLLDFTEEDPGL